MSDDTGDGDVVVERLPADDAFELLAHGTRLRVLELLNEADGPLTFSELHDRVEMRDSGGFNYHLSKLVGRFVTASDEGYELAGPGRRVVGAVLSGGYTKSFDEVTVPVDGGCLVCDGPLEAALGEERVHVACLDCGQTYADTDVPAGVVEGYPREEIPAVVHRWITRNYVSAQYGFCHNCDGRVDLDVLVEGRDAPEWLEEYGLSAVLRSACRRCGDVAHASVSVVALTHPAVAGFHHDHGVDVRETPAWDIDWVEEGVTEVLDRDPVRVAVPSRLDGVARTFVFDADFDLVETRHG